MNDIELKKDIGSEKGINDLKYDILLVGLDLIKTFVNFPEYDINAKNANIICLLILFISKNNDINIIQKKCDIIKESCKILKNNFEFLRILDSFKKIFTDKMFINKKDYEKILLNYGENIDDILVFDKSINMQNKSCNYGSNSFVLIDAKNNENQTPNHKLDSVPIFEGMVQMIDPATNNTSYIYTYYFPNFNLTKTKQISGTQQLSDAQQIDDTIKKILDTVNVFNQYDGSSEPVKIYDNVIGDIIPNKNPISYINESYLDENDNKYFKYAPIRILCDVIFANFKKIKGMFRKHNRENDFLKFTEQFNLLNVREFVQTIINTLNNLVLLEKYIADVDVNFIIESNKEINNFGNELFYFFDRVDESYKNNGEQHSKYNELINKLFSNLKGINNIQNFGEINILANEAIDYKICSSKKKQTELLLLSKEKLMDIKASFPVMFKDKIKEMIAKTLNENVNANIAFEDVDLSLFKSFPQAHVTIDKLSIINKAPFAGDTLLYAGETNVTMSVKEFFSQ